MWRGFARWKPVSLLVVVGLNLTCLVAASKSFFSVCLSVWIISWTPGMMAGEKGRNLAMPMHGIQF